MKIEPSIDKMELKQKIQDVYNLDVKNFKFVPVGEIASSYIVTTKKNDKYCSLSILWKSTSRILFEEKDPIQVKSDFEGLKEDVLPVLPNMKEIEKNLRRKAKEW